MDDRYRELITSHIDHAERVVDRRRFSQRALLQDFLNLRVGDIDCRFGLRERQALRQSEQGS
jgi:hypothetical protein